MIVLQANQLLLIQLQLAQHLELTIIQVASDGIGFVNDNPMQEYTCKADAAVTQANLLSTITKQWSFTARTAKDGQSTVKIRYYWNSSNNSMFRIVRTGKRSSKQ